MNWIQIEKKWAEMTRRVRTEFQSEGEVRNTIRVISQNPRAGAHPEPAKSQQ